MATLKAIYLVLVKRIIKKFECSFFSLRLKSSCLFFRSLEWQKTQHGSKTSWTSWSLFAKTFGRVCSRSRLTTCEQTTRWNWAPVHDLHWYWIIVTSDIKWLTPFCPHKQFKCTLVITWAGLSVCVVFITNDEDVIFVQSCVSSCSFCAVLVLLPCISGHLRSPGQQVSIAESAVSWKTVLGTGSKGTSLYLFIITPYLS